MRRIINMKDYKMINEAIAVAEGLLKTTKQDYEVYAGNAEFQIKYQICEYIYELLRNAEFPQIQGLKYLGDAEVCFNSANYLCDGKSFQYQLFIRDYASNKVSRIYFNREEYYENTMQPIEESTLIALIKKWDYIKKRLPEQIDAAYQAKIDAIKKEADRIKKQREILDGFKL